MQSIRSRTAPFLGVAGGVLATAVTLYGCGEGPLASHLSGVADSARIRAAAAHPNATQMSGGLTRCHWPADSGSTAYCPIGVTFTPTKFQGHLDSGAEQFDP